MKKSKTSIDKIIKERAVEAAKTASDKKAKDIIILQLSDLTAFADYFVICSGENPVQIRTIAEAIEQDFKTNAGIKPMGIEGMANGQWVLMDYGDIIIHIFNEESRSFYDLEKLWMDAPRISFKG
ncbi:MAG: ribosome silencing factor [Thermodesulfovibrionia bacterium]|nr:ribosome silencing factor [Thermodesulfovibrionia bacterium]